MGGRGSSGGGWGGGGGFSGNIDNERDLVVDRERNQTLVDQVLTVMRDVERDYGHVIEQAVIADLSGRGSRNVMAYSDPNTGNIGVNSRYWDEQKIVEAYRRSVEAGFHPSNGSKSEMEALFSHEMGHSLHDAIGDRLGLNGLEAAKRILTDAFGTDVQREQVANAAKISGYAKANPKECVAEAFADVYCNGNNAKTESRKIVAVMKRYMGR